MASSAREFPPGRRFASTFGVFCRWDTGSVFIMYCALWCAKIKPSPASTAGCLDGQKHQNHFGRWCARLRQRQKKVKQRHLLYDTRHGWNDAPANVSDSQGASGFVGRLVCRTMGQRRGDKKLRLVWVGRPLRTRPVTRKKELFNGVGKKA